MNITDRSFIMLLPPSNATLSTMSSDDSDWDDEETLVSGHLSPECGDVGASQPVKTATSKLTTNFLLEPCMSRGRLSIPLQSSSRPLLKFLIGVPLCALACLAATNIYLIPLLAQQGLFRFAESTLWDTFVHNRLAFLLLVAIPIATALAYDLWRECLTFAMLLRGRHRRFLPSHIPRLRHAVIICNYKEPIEVLRATVESIANNTVANACMVILACEDRDPQAKETFALLYEQFASSFHSIICTRHALAQGEVAGKSSNENHACRELYRMVQEEGIDPFRVMVTSCDADSLFDVVYFEQLEAEYCRMPDGRRCIYNAPINTYRNLPECNTLVKIFEIKRCQFDCFRGFAFRPAQSNYSLTLGFAEEINFWDPSNTSEDFHTTIKAMASTGTGKHIVVPVWSLILNDSVCGLKDRWIQARRHMWGIEEVAFTVSLFPVVRINLWLRLLTMVSTQMFAPCTPAWISLLFPSIRAVFLNMNPRTHRSLLVNALVFVVYSWLKMVIREVFLYRYILRGRKHMMARSKWEWCQITLLWPVLSGLGAFIFSCLATWRVLVHAVFCDTLHYVTAPKAWNTPASATSLTPKKRS